MSQLESLGQKDKKRRNSKFKMKRKLSVFADHKAFYIENAIVHINRIYAQNGWN